MRVGLSWDLDQWTGVDEAWKAVIAEIEQADQMGFESVWLHEGRDHVNDCPAPDLFLTFAAKRTRSIQLRVAGRRVAPASPVRIAEQIAVLDTFSRGRAGLAFAAASSQGVPVGHVHEVVDFVSAAWVADDLRYRGEHLRFPAHTPDDAPVGASEPTAPDAYVPQWEWGPIMPDFLAITPKPYAARPPLHLDIADDETLEWAACGGIAPIVGPDLSTEEATERLARYRDTAEKAGRHRREVEPVIERRISLDAPGDAARLGGSTREILEAVRAIRARGFVSHFVWRRDGSTPMDLYRFASEVQPLLQA